MSSSTSSRAWCRAWRRVHAAQRDRGRHPRRRRPSTRGRAARPASTWSSSRSVLLEAEDGRGRTMTAPDARVADRMLRTCSGTASAAGRWRLAALGRRRSSTRRRCSRLRRARRRRSRSTAGPSGGIADEADRSWPATLAACSPSTATRTRRGQLSLLDYGAQQQVVIASSPPGRSPPRALHARR